MWQIIVSIIKMTLQFLWEQVLHKVTAAPCHLEVVYMNHQLHMETVLQMPKLTHLILLTQGRAPAKSIPTIRWRKGPYTDITKRASNPPSDTSQGCPKAHYMALSTDFRHLDAKRPLWWCSWNCWGAHLTGDREEPALTRRQNLHYTQISRAAAGYTSLHPDANSVFRKDFHLPERDILNIH